MSKLYIVPTPIGNLEDLSFRALRILNEADLILAEDTRTSGVLLKHYQVNTPMISFHSHNEHQKLKSLLEKLHAGLSLAVISDAGTPSISDPGFLLVREVLKEGIEVECLPGSTALIPALVQSGLPCDRFVFEGFLPLKKGKQSRLEALSKESRTVVLYESPHRLLKTLEQCTVFFGANRKVVICRELSKVYEETFRGTFETAIKHFSETPPKGEFVICIDKKST